MPDTRPFEPNRQHDIAKLIATAIVLPFGGLRVLDTLGQLSASLDRLDLYLGYVFLAYFTAAIVVLRWKGLRALVSPYILEGGVLYAPLVLFAWPYVYVQMRVGSWGFDDTAQSISENTPSP